MKDISTEIQASSCQAIDQFKHIFTLIKSFKKKGVIGAVISPGSRNTPLVLIAQQMMHTQVIIDERAAGFFALGWAKKARSPILLICTSGSAGAHYLPAVIEAKASSVPLIICTADRPKRLRSKGAPQTIEQRNLYTDFVTLSYDVEVSDSPVEGWKNRAHQLYNEAMTFPESPVHLNICLEEPLWSQTAEQWLHDQSTMVEIETQPTHLNLQRDFTSSYQLLRELNLPDTLINGQGKGVFYCGPLSPQVAQKVELPLSKIAQRLGWPIFCEIASQLRASPLLTTEVSYAEGLARSNKLPNRPIDWVICIGAHTHSRAWRSWFESTNVQKGHVFLGERADPANPSRLHGAEVFECCVDQVLSAWDMVLNQQNNRVDHFPLKPTAYWSSPPTQQALIYANQSAHQAVSGLANERYDPYLLWGGQIGTIISKAFPQKSVLHLANSMSFRDADLGVMNRPDFTIWSNRGANGIDGTLSCALGCALGSSSDVIDTHNALETHIVWIGDLAAHHDLQGLNLLAECEPMLVDRNIRFVIFLMNNGGGGIFHQLPIVESQKFTPLFFTPSSLPIAKIAKILGFKVYQSKYIKELNNIVEKVLNDTARLTLIEIQLDASFDAEAHRVYWRRFNQSIHQQNYP